MNTYKRTLTAILVVILYVFVRADTSQNGATGVIDVWTGTYLAGWALDQNTGQTPDSCTLLVHSPSHGWEVQTLTVAYTGLYRPDVAAYFGGDTSDYTGWAFYPDTVRDDADQFRVEFWESSSVGGDPGNWVIWIAYLNLGIL